MTNYEINKAVYKACPPMEPIEIFNHVENCSELIEHAEQFYMILCNERKDYTVYQMVSPRNNPWKSVVIDATGLMRERGILKGMESNTDGTIDYWVEIAGEVYMYKLFVCDDFVIKV